MGPTTSVTHNSPPLPTTSFVSRRLNQSTFLLIEDDAFDEQPYIYVKIYPNKILITDTGCNSPRQKDRSITSLREFIEHYPLPINQGRPLNPNGEKKYIIICSHCHYDHILGLPDFSSANPTIIASGFNKDFLLKDLGRNSLCNFLDVPTPDYKISNWANHMESFISGNDPCRVQFLQVPGHTPDSLAWYDFDENHLYVGDTFYGRTRDTPIPELDDDIPEPSALAGAIIFPDEGANLIEYMASLDTLLSFAFYRNQQLRKQYGDDPRIAPRVKVGCGHITHSADAEEMIQEVQALFEDIIAGKVPVHSTMVVRGAVYDFFLESEDARYSVRVPQRLVEDARKHFNVSSSLRME